MKKRLFSIFLCLCMVVTLASAMVPTAAAATDELGKPFGKEVTANNPYPGKQIITDEKYPDGSEKWTYPCTLYAWQRVYNDHGIELLPWGSAKDWLLKAETAGFRIGDTPEANSIVVYSGGKYGHVAYVEGVDGDTMTVSEGGRTLDRYQGTGGIALNESSRATAKGSIIWNVYKLEGYIYLGAPISVDPPGIPKNITGEWTSTGPKWQARISWDAVSGATRYEVQYRTPTANGWSAWKTDGDYKSGTSYISTGLGTYDSYEYRVRACNSGGVSAWKPYTLEKNASGSVTVPTNPNIVTPPTKPKFVFATWAFYPKMTARVSWSAVSGAELYRVQYKKANESIWCSAPATSGTSYTVPGLGVDTSWDFRVEAVNAGGASGWTECSLSAQKDIVTNLNGEQPSSVAAPAGVSGRWKSTGSNATAELTWNPVNDVDHYEVGYKKDGGSWVTLPLCIMSTKTSYGFNNLDSSSSYSLRVKAVKSGVSSAWAECTLTKSETVVELAAPSGVSGTWTSTGSKWQARISWNAVSGAIRYEVQYRTPKTGNAWKTDADYSSGTSYISTGLGDYNSYDYRIRAVNANGTSDWTEYTLVKTVSTPDPVPVITTPTTSTPAAPTNVSGIWTSTGPKWQARISWNAVSGATRYEVQYRTPKTGNAWKTDADYSSGTSYISTGLGDYNSYDYRVRAVNANGASEWTEYTLIKTVSTPDPAPAATTPATPTNVSGTWTSRGPNWQARISWDAVSGATYYEVQYRTPTTGNAWRTDTDYSSGTSYISTGLGNYNSYDYRVRAVNANGASEWTEYTLYK